RGADGAPGEDDASARELTEDELGLVDGYRWNESIAVDGSDGLYEAEFDAVVARAMARIERDRGLNFERTVPVDVVSRAEYRESSSGLFGSYDAVDTVAWRASFIVGDEGNVTAAFDELYGSSVAGYYTSAGGGKIVIVSDDPDAVRIDRSTLVHELVHALQDQQFGIARATDTRDERLAWNGLIEGEANYLMQRYDADCGAAFECVDVSTDGRGPASESLNMGLYLTTFLPYSDGPAFVDDLHERGGWDAVDRAYENPPTSTAQIIHPERYPDDPPREVTVTDRSDGEWERFGASGSDEDGSGESGETVESSESDARTERLGEASLFAGLWHNGVIGYQYPFSASGEHTIYRYEHPITDGWDGDVLVPYRDGDGRTGYVLRTAWTNASEATAFRGGYERLLDSQNATEVSAGVYRVPESASFTGAYRVTRTDDVVTIVHAPTVDALDGVHAPTVAAAETAARDSVAASPVESDAAGAAAPANG
ncbi:Hvo_1808 family surface protein, partial [Natronoarchaeum mannanilyticum]|uniref:Hvo_1808 family surface protein n=1 Tax=Natronoarchaeum mannanilyticum TaxID=926360 RepID=UPI0036123B52